MPSWLLPIVLLACPVGMGLMMWFMMRAMRGQHQEPMQSSKGAMSPTQRLAGLEAEKEALEREIAASRHEGQTHGRSAPIADKKRA